MSRTRYFSLLAAIALVLASSVPVAAAKDKKTRKPRTEDIINVFLGLARSQWLVGPAYYIASEEERASFLKLTSDTEAEAFIKEFWKRRDPEPDMFGNPVLDRFERRAEAADIRYRERAVLGSRTDRGAIFVLFGEPDLIQFDGGTRAREPDLEIWSYSDGSSEGFGRLTPQRRYFFAEVDGKTVLYRPRANRKIDLRQ